MDFKKIFKNIKLDKIKKIKKINKNIILMAVAIFCVAITGVLILMNFGPSDKAIAQTSIDYINTNLLQGQGTATLGTVSKEAGLIKFQVRISDQTFDSYATKDGKLFFPQAFNLKDSSGGTESNTITE